MDWPPYSPNLNFIENIWAWLKQEVDRLFLTLKFETSKSEESLK